MSKNVQLSRYFMLAVALAISRFSPLTSQAFAATATGSPTKASCAIFRSPEKLYKFAKSVILYCSIW